MGVVVCWYTIETRRLRKATDAQVRLLTTQAAAAIRPLAQPTFNGFGYNEAGYPPTPVISARVENPVDAVALYVGVLVMINGKWHVATETIPSVLGGAPIYYLTPFKSTSDPAELRSFLEADYPEIPEALLLCLQSRKDSWIATISLDLHGQHYLVKRRISDSGGVARNFRPCLEYPVLTNSPRTSRCCSCWIFAGLPRKHDETG